MAPPKHKMPNVRLKRAPRYTPVSKRQDKPDAVYWLIKNHPEFTDSEIIKLIGTTKATIAEDPRALALECRQHQGGGSGDPGPYLAAGAGSGGEPRRPAGWNAPPSAPRARAPSLKPISETTGAGAGGVAAARRRALRRRARAGRLCFMSSELEQD